MAGHKCMDHMVLNQTSKNTAFLFNVYASAAKYIKSFGKQQRISSWMS